jgi:hypothetical protein
VARANNIPASVPPIARTFADHAAARDAILALEAAGLSPDDISVVTRTPAEAETLEHDTGASEELEEATQHHHRLADLVDWLGRVESAAVPGFGAVLGTGDLWQDVSLSGSGRGSITGALVGRGFSVDEAASLEAAVFDGKILVVIQSANDAAAVLSALAPR